MKTISDRIKGRRINDAYLTLKAMPQDDWKYAFTAPDYLLLLPEDSLTSFFRDGKVDNAVTSFASSKLDGLTYSFGNIGALLKYQIDNNPGLEELNLLVIPVERTLQTDYYGNPTSSSTSVDNYLRPSGVKLRKEPAVMQFQVITSRYDID
jgi:hypothetical protein